jgi:excisionase family DNA binding protein
MEHRPRQREMYRQSAGPARQRDGGMAPRESASAYLLREPLLDASQAAELLHVPRSTLYELVRSRGLPQVKVGRGLRFTRADLAVWIADNSYGRSART